MLPLSGETKETGTLARFLGTLGIDVTEVDLDEDSDEEGNGDNQLEDEAQEVSAAVAATTEEVVTSGEDP